MKELFFFENFFSSKYSCVHVDNHAEKFPTQSWKHFAQYTKKITKVYLFRKLFFSKGARKLQFWHTWKKELTTGSNALAQCQKALKCVSFSKKKFFFQKSSSKQAGCSFDNAAANFSTHSWKLFCSKSKNSRKKLENISKNLFWLKLFDWAR